MRKLAVVVVFAVVAFVLPASVCMAQPLARIEKGQTAPGFTLKSVKGKPVSLSQFRGKLVVLNFWATWCPHCRVEMPSLERLNEVFAGKKFVLLAVNVDDDGGADLKAYLAKHPYSFTVLPDPHGVVQDLYGVDRYPETFIISKDGKIIDRVLGSIDWSSVQVLRYFSHLLGR